MYQTVREDPFDFSESMGRLSPDRVSEAVKDGIQPVTSDSSNQLKKDEWNYRVQVLMLERDARGLLELRATLKREKAPREMIIWADSLAHFLTGRSATTVAICKSTLESNMELPPSATINAQLLLGFLYYEQGDYLKAKEAFEYIANVEIAGSWSYYKDTAMRFLSKIKLKT